MTTQALPAYEKDPFRIAQAVRELQRGRNNAHGEFTLNGNGSDTEITVPAPNCAPGSHVSIAPTTANAAGQFVSGAMYWVAGKSEFTVTHGATSNSDETFTYGIVG